MSVHRRIPCPFRGVSRYYLHRGEAIHTGDLIWSGKAWRPITKARLKDDPWVLRGESVLRKGDPPSRAPRGDATTHTVIEAAVAWWKGTRSIGDTGFQPGLLDEAAALDRAVSAYLKDGGSS